MISRISQRLFRQAVRKLTISKQWENTYRKWYRC